MRFTSELIWQTDVPVEECASRIQRATEKDSVARWFRLFGDQGTVYSTIKGNSFRLFAKGPAFMRNSFEPYFYGSFGREAGRTVVRGGFRPQALVIAFMAVWFSFVLLIGGVIAVSAVVEVVTGRRALHGRDLGTAALVLLGMLVFGVGLVALGWRIGRGQRERIKTVIEGTLQAHRLTPATDPLSRSLR
jgi:hypothetical protein